MVLWIKVSDDEYELPEMVADTSTELSRMCGLDGNSVQSAISNAKRRKSKCQYKKVEISDDEEEAEQTSGKGKEK